MFQYFKLLLSFGGAEEGNWKIVQDLFLHVLKYFVYVPKISVPVLCLFNAKSVVMLEFTPHRNPLLLLLHSVILIYFLSNNC